MTFIEQGFQPCAAISYRARFVAIRDRIAEARLGGTLFLTAVSKERGPTASGFVVAAAALAALGAFIYRDWIAETGFTSRKYDQARQLFQQAIQEVVYPGRQPRAAKSRHFWAYF